MDAAAKEDYEAFHDLAWRAAQKSRPNDAELMYLLARAQSLSGRPGDALVMLRRLAQMGVATDVKTSDDFRRVRALPGWAELEALMNDTASGATPLRTAPPRQRQPLRHHPRPARHRRRRQPPPWRPRIHPAAPDAGVVGVGEDTLRLTMAGIDPVGLAYDSASRTLRPW